MMYAAISYMVCICIYLLGIDLSAPLAAGDILRSAFRPTRQGAGPRAIILGPSTGISHFRCL